MTVSYYTSIIFLTWLALGVLSVLIRENDRLPKEEKRFFYLTYALIALAAFSEWLATRLAGSSAPGWAVRAAKCADYILTPAAAGSIVGHFRGHLARKKLLLALLSMNAALQLVSVFTGWMVIIDDQNRCAPGPLHGIYVAFYLLVSFAAAFEFFRYGRKFRRQNRLSLYAILAFAAAGVILQEAVGNQTAYICLTMGMSMLFIHYSEFSQLAADDHAREQERLLTRDALTGVLNRYAYEKAIAELDAEDDLPRELTVFSIDVNGLKLVNDTLGHEAGDELIRGAARCIEAALGEWGKCYRTGGDEFVVLALMDQRQIQGALLHLTAEAYSWHGEKAKALYLAVGCAAAASLYRDYSVERLVSMADRAMYREKDAYYRETGAKRRGAPPSAERQKQARITPAVLR